MNVFMSLDLRYDVHVVYIYHLLGSLVSGREVSRRVYEMG